MKLVVEDTVVGTAIDVVRAMRATRRMRERYDAFRLRLRIEFRVKEDASQRAEFVFVALSGSEEELTQEAKTFLTGFLQGLADAV